MKKSTLPLASAAAVFTLLLTFACDQSPSGEDGPSTSSGGDDSLGGARSSGGKSGSGGSKSGSGGSKAGDGGSKAGDGGMDAGGASAPGGANDPGNSPEPVDLELAETFAILAKSGIATAPTSAITGNIGVSPVAATYITEFSLEADPSNVFSTSSQVVGQVFAADYAPPTPANLGLAIGDMELAFTDAAGRAPDVTELGAGDIGGKTLTPGVYKWGTSLLIPTDVTLSGSASDVWIFQIAGDLTMSSAAKVILEGGALPKNIFWQVGGLAELGTTAHCEGIILTQTGITLRTGASVNGRLLAQTAVIIDSSTVVEPAP